VTCVITLYILMKKRIGFLRETAGEWLQIMRLFKMFGTTVVLVPIKLRWHRKKLFFTIYFVVQFILALRCIDSEFSNFF